MTWHGAGLELLEAAVETAFSRAGVIAPGPGRLEPEGHAVYLSYHEELMENRIAP